MLASIYDRVSVSGAIVASASVDLVSEFRKWSCDRLRLPMPPERGETILTSTKSNMPYQLVRSSERTETHALRYTVRNTE